MPSTIVIICDIAWALALIMNSISLFYSLKAAAPWLPRVLLGTWDWWPRGTCVFLWKLFNHYNHQVVKFGGVFRLVKSSKIYQLCLVKNAKYSQQLIKQCIFFNLEIDSTNSSRIPSSPAGCLTKYRSTMMTHIVNFLDNPTLSGWSHRLLSKSTLIKGIISFNLMW